MATGYTFLSGSVRVDLDDVFEVRSTTARANTGFKVGSQDLAARFEKSAGGDTLGINVNFKSSGTDLSALFKKLVRYNLIVYSGSGDGLYAPNVYANIVADTAPDNYHFSQWIGSGITNTSAASTTVLMDADKIVSASYAINQFTLTVSSGTGGGTQNYDYVYTIVANAPSAEQYFTFWASLNSPTFVNGSSAANSTAYITISQNTSIGANYAWNTYYLTVTYGSGDGTYAYNANMSITAEAAPPYQVFSQWINPAGSLSFANSLASTTTANFTAGGNATAEATYKWIDYTITIAKDGGIDYTTPAVGSDLYQYPDFPVSVTATTKYDYDFSHWILDGTNVGSSNPYSITSVANHTITAYSVLKNVAFTLSGANGNPTANYGSIVPIHTTVTITPNPNTYYQFSYLSANNSAIVSGTTVQLEGVGTTAITVVYSAINYTITVSKDAGVTSVNPAVGANSYTYTSFPISVTATLPYDRDLNYWLLDGVNVGNANPYSITTIANHTISANSILKNVGFTLSSGGGGSPTANYGTYPSAVVPIHTVVTITPNPSTYYQFSYLSATNGGVVSGTTVQLEQPGLTAITAYYSLINYTITVSKDANVTSVSPGVGANSYVYTSFPVSVTATMPYDYDLNYWLLDGVNVGNANPYSISSIGNHTISANSILKNVAFNASSAGNGSISPTSGIKQIHSSQTFTCTPNTGYSFSYLSADNSAVVTGTSVKFDGVGTTYVTAYFSINQYTLTVIYGSGGGTANYGNTYNISAGTYDGYVFSHWQTNAGSITYGDVNDPTTTATIGAGNATTEAIYDAI